MSRALRRQGPAIVVAVVVLVAALGGTVYAAGKINGHTVKVKSLPGNRLAVGSVPGNRLKPGAVGKAQLAPDSITRVQIDMSQLGQVPSAVHAETAESAQEAVKAQEAGKAEEAKLVNGHRAECETGTRYFGGACWQILDSATALTAPGAAAACAQQGGELPEALALKAFAEEEGIELASGGEWTSDIVSFTSEDAYSLAIISPALKVGSAVSTSAKKFRCVIPLVH
jgi:hypothetical protein